MGRLSFELAYVLPNDSQRRVYMTDDGDNRMLAHFVATKPGALDCGTLWGATVTQTSELNGAPQLLETFFLACTQSDVGIWGRST